MPGTSEIPFFSSLHGRDRRESRGIARRDLQGALEMRCVRGSYNMYLSSSRKSVTDTSVLLLLLYVYKLVRDPGDSHHLNYYHCVLCYHVFY